MAVKLSAFGVVHALASQAAQVNYEGRERTLLSFFLSTCSEQIRMVQREAKELLREKNASNIASGQTISLISENCAYC